MSGTLESCVPCDCNFPIAPVGEQGPQGGPGPTGPRGPQGPPGTGGGGGLAFDTYADFVAQSFQPSDVGKPVTILGYYAPGDGGGSTGYLDDTPVAVGTSVTVTDHVATMTAASHGLKDGDWIAVTGTVSWNTSASAPQPVQVIDASTFQYVVNAVNVGATVVVATITLKTAGLYRTVFGDIIYRATSKGVINALWFGCIDSGSLADKSTNTSGINSAAYSAWGEQCEYWLPKRQGIYYIGTQLFMREGTIFRCHGYVKNAPNPAVVQFVVPGDAFTILGIYKNELTNGTADGIGGFTTKGSNWAIYGDNLGVLDGSSTETAPVFNGAGAPTYFSVGGGTLFGIVGGGCDNVLIDSLKVKNAVTFAIGFQFCRNVNVLNVNVDTGGGNQISRVTGTPLVFNGKNQDGVHFTDCTDCSIIGGQITSSDDQMAATTVLANTKNIRFIGVKCVHKMTGDRPSDGNGLGANDYVALGFGCRVAGEAGAFFCDTVVVSACEFVGGNGALVIRGVVGGTLQQNITFADNIVRDKTDPGIVTIAAMRARSVCDISGCTNLKVCDNQFYNINRFISVTRNTGEPATQNIEIENNKFSHFGKLDATQTASSVTHVGTTATFNSVAHGFVVGDTVTISGANQAPYNGSFTILSGGFTANAFTYTMASDPGANATGTVLANATRGSSYWIIDTVSVNGDIESLTICDNKFNEIWLGAIRVNGSTGAASTMRYIDIGDNEFNEVGTWARDNVKNSGGLGVVAVNIGAECSIESNRFRNIYATAIGLVVTNDTKISDNSIFDVGRANLMTDANGIQAVGTAGGPGLTNIVIHDNDVNGCDGPGILMESVDTFDAQRNRIVNAGRQTTTAAMFQVHWRTSGGTYNFAAVRGIVRNCFVVTTNANNFGFDSQISGTSPTLAAAIAGMPVVFDNCDVQGLATLAYSMTPNSTDAIPVPLPLGAIRKTSIIGGLYGGKCNLNSAVTVDIPIPICNLGKRYRITRIATTNASTNFAGSPVVAEIRSAAGGAGDQIVATLGVTTLANNTFIESQTLTAAANTLIRTETELYVRMTTNNGGAGTCDIEISGELYE